MLRVFLLLSFVLVSRAAFAEADGPDSWRVTGVGSNDTLSARAGPATSYPRIGRLAHNARGIRTIVCVPTLNLRNYERMSAEQKRKIDGMSRWCLVASEGQRKGWVNARYLSEDGEDFSFESGQNAGDGFELPQQQPQSQTQHAQICATSPQINVSLSDPQLWRRPDGQRAVDVVQNFSPHWDRSMSWFSGWQDAGRSFAKGETSFDFSVQFCSCGSQQARYDIQRIRVDDRAEIFFDGTNWKDIPVNFRGNQPYGSARKTSVQDFNRSLMLRIHNDPGTLDNPLGFAIEGRLFAQNSYLGYCQK